MDSWSFVDNVKLEKASAMRRYNRLRTIARLFRFTELCLFAVLLSWTFSRLPFALRISIDYFRLFSGIVSSPLFVFLVCNVIIVSLFAKSRHFSTSPPNIDVVDTQLYGQLSDNCNDKKSNTSGEDLMKEEVVYEDKQIISDVNAAYPVVEVNSDSGAETESGLEFTKDIRRTKSEKFERDIPAKLKRSDTENSRNMLRAGEETVPEDSDQEDGLSNEEFQRAIEAFIERQKRFRHQEESLAIVLQNQS